VRLGEPDALENLKGAKLITYLDMPSIKDVVGDDISSWIILLGSSEATGFQDRNWQPTVMLPAQHRAYAVQWFALALAMIIMWLVMSRKRVTTGDHPPGSDSTNPGQQKK
jgi:cytochrome oxidase assembly protein ShyY1